jgi:hypothetical protein
VPGRRQQDAGEVEPAITSNYTTPDYHLLDAFNELKASRLGAAVEDGVRLVLDNVTELPLGFSSAHVISRPIGPVMVMKDELGRTCPVAWWLSDAEVCDRHHAARVATGLASRHSASPRDLEVAAALLGQFVAARHGSRGCGPRRTEQSLVPAVSIVGMGNVVLSTGRTPIASSSAPAPEPERRLPYGHPRAIGFRWHELPGIPGVDPI